MGNLSIVENKHELVAVVIENQIRQKFIFAILVLKKSYLTG